VLGGDLTRNEIARRILFEPYLHVSSHDLGEDPGHFDTPVIELLNDDSKYWKFLDFWTSIMNK
jgi:hypothetical protein